MSEQSTMAKMTSNNDIGDLSDVSVLSQIDFETDEKQLETVSDVSMDEDYESYTVQEELNSEHMKNNMQLERNTDSRLTIEYLQEMFTAMTVLFGMRWAHSKIDYLTWK